MNRLSPEQLGFWLSQGSPKNMEEEKPSARELSNSETNTGDYDVAEARLTDLCKVSSILIFSFFFQLSFSPL